MVKYLVRLDDACPTMDSSKWKAIEDILDKYKIKPLVGVIPDNKDENLMIEGPDPNFWQKIKSWQNKGWSIALHGFDHCYISSDHGINPLWPRSEFAGVSLDQQKDKISNGMAILNSHGIYPKYFFAPSHTFDENTLQALKAASTIRLVSDTFGRFPYKYDDDFIFIPCQMGSFRNIPLKGYWTFCFHPNGMNESSIAGFETFIVKNRNKFISFSDLPLDKVTKKSFTDKLLSESYFLMRKLKNLI